MLKAPQGKCLLTQIKPDKPKSVLILSDPDALRDVSRGIIVSKGADVEVGIKTRYRSIPEIMEGDTVAYRSLTIEKNGKLINRNEFEHENQKYVMVDFEDILAIYN